MIAKVAAMRSNLFPAGAAAVLAAARERPPITGCAILAGHRRCRGCDAQAEDKTADLAAGAIV